MHTHTQLCQCASVSTSFFFPSSENTLNPSRTKITTTTTQKSSTFSIRFFPFNALRPFSHTHSLSRSPPLCHTGWVLRLCILFGLTLESKQVHTIQYSTVGWHPHERPYLSSQVKHSEWFILSYMAPLSPPLPPPPLSPSYEYIYDMCTLRNAYACKRIQSVCSRSRLIETKNTAWK